MPWFSLLYTFLLERFTDEELRQLAARHAPELAAALPAEPIQRGELATAIIRLLERRGRLDPRFFARLRRDRPRLSPRVDAIEHAFIEAQPVGRTTAPPPDPPPPPPDLTPPPAPTPPSPGRPAEPWDAALHRFLCEAFDNDELRRLCVHHVEKELAHALPAVELSRDRFCFAAVDLLKRHGLCNAAFFDLLRRERRRWCPTIDAIQRACTSLG